VGKIENDLQWVRRGRQKRAVAQMLRRPMTASEICRFVQPLDPHLQLRDVWFLMRQFIGRGLVRCLNPDRFTGKVYAWSEYGQRVAAVGFNLAIAPCLEGVDWQRYALVVRARLRKLLLLELLRPLAAKWRTASALRKRLLDKHPVGLNSTLRALKELEHLGLVRSAALRSDPRHKAYQATFRGRRIGEQMLL